MYYTKKNTTPQEYVGFLQAAFVWRARQNAGLNFLDAPYWAEKAYLLGLNVYAQIEAEHYDNDGQDEGYVGGNTGLPKGIDGEAFQLIKKHLIERQADGR